MVIKKNKFWIIVALIVISGVLWYSNFSLHFNGFFWNDSHDYNQMARNIYEGRGFSTSVLRPMNFSNFKTLPHPEITRPPVYPYLLAFFYLLFGLNDFSVVLLDGLFYVLLVVATFLFTSEFSKSRLTSLLVTACVAFSPIFLRMSIIGSSDIVYAALAVLFFYLYIKYHEKAFIIGITAGLLYITRMNTLFLIAAIVLLDYNPLIQKKNWKRLLAFFLGLVPVIAPMLIKNIIFSSSAVSSVNYSGLVLFTKSYPGYTYWVQINNVSVLDFIRTHPGEVYEKIVNSFFGLMRDFKHAFGITFLILMISGIFVPLKNESFKRLKRIVLFTALIQAFVIIPISAEARYYIFIAPVLISFVFVYIDSLNKDIFKKIACAIILSAVVLSSIQFWNSPKQFNYFPFLGDAVRAQTNKNDVIASDIAWEISWYADRRAVWLPYDIETLDKISESIPVDYMLLSANLAHPYAPYKDNIWQRLFFNANSFNVPGFKLANVFYYGNLPIGVLYKVERKQVTNDYKKRF